MDTLQHDGGDPAASAYAAALGAGAFERAFAIVAEALDHGYRTAGTAGAFAPWFDRLDIELARFGGTLPARLETAAFAAALPLLAMRPAHPALPLLSARALARLRFPDSADDALIAAHLAFEFALRSGNFPKMREVVVLARAQCAAAAAPRRIDWLEAEALACWLEADHAAAYDTAKTARSLGGGYGAIEQEASAALSAGDLARVDACLAEMSHWDAPLRPQDVGHRAFLAAGRALAGGDPRAARSELTPCRNAAAAGASPYFAMLWQLGDAHVAMALGQSRAAERDLGRVLAGADASYWRFLAFSAAMARAWLRARAGRADDALRDLSYALPLARGYCYRNVDPWWTPAMADELVAFAAPHDHDGETLRAWAARRMAVR